jgi:hypothetical protein
VVTNPAGSSAANAVFSYTAPAAPTISSLLVNSGPVAGGTETYIYGNNFVNTGLAVTIGGTAATGVNLISRNIIRCTTPAGTAGAANVVVTTGSGVGTLAGGFIYTELPAITSAPALTAQVGALYTYNIVATGSPSPAITASGLPAWLSLVGSTLSGTPSAGDIGLSGAITITASNGLLPNAVQTFQIDVTGQPPQFTSTEILVATVGMPYIYVVTATGAPAPVLSAVGLPGWLTFNPANGLLSGVPGPGDLGLSGVIDITASNGWPPAAVQSFQIQVNGTAPIITSTAPTTVAVGALYTYTVVATGNPAPTIGVSGEPGWLTLVGNVLSGTPGPADLGVTGLITITAANGRGVDATEQFTITVAGVAPQITSTAPTSVVAGSVYIYTMTAIGSPTPVINATGLPPWLTQVGNVLSGTPTGANVGTTGLITVTAANGVAPDALENFTITVTGSAPLFTSTPVTIAGTNIPYNYAVEVEGSPRPTLVVTSALPAWLTFNASTGLLSGTPTAADAGIGVDVTIDATNGVGASATQSFTIAVANTSPPAPKSDEGCTAGSGNTLPALLGLMAPVAIVLGRRRRD